jgi:hypothetical protein
MVLVTSGTSGFNQLVWNSAKFLVSLLAYPLPTGDPSLTEKITATSWASIWKVPANASTATVLTCGAFSISIPSPL